MLSYFCFSIKSTLKILTQHQAPLRAITSHRGPGGGFAETRRQLPHVACPGPPPPLPTPVPAEEGAGLVPGRTGLALPHVGGGGSFPLQTRLQSYF